MKVGRNDPCSCGSGKKYKKCCMREHQEAAQAAAKLPEHSAPLTDLENSLALPAPAALSEAADIEAELSAEKLNTMEEAVAQLQASGDPAQMKKLQEQMASLQALMSLGGNKDER